MRQVTDPEGQVWDVDQLGSGSGAYNHVPGTALPPHTAAIVRVTRDGHKIVAHIPLDWRKLENSALWTEIQRGRST